MNFSKLDDVDWDRWVPERRATLRERTAALREAVGAPAGTTPIVPVVIGAPEAAMQAARMLEEAGLVAVALRPPTVPEGEAGLRLTVSVAHTPADISALGAALASAVAGGQNGETHGAQTRAVARKTTAGRTT